MQIIKIEKLENGGHYNQTNNAFKRPPEGWALIPDGMETPNFPFGDIEVQDINGIQTVTKWTAGIVPELDPSHEPEPTAQDDTDSMLIDHEYRITLLELGVNE